MSIEQTNVVPSNSQIVSPEELEALEIEMVEAMNEQIAESSEGDETLAEAMTEIAEEITGLDIDGDGLVGDGTAEFGAVEANVQGPVVYAPTEINVVNDVDVVAVDSIEIVDSSVTNTAEIELSSEGYDWQAESRQEATDAQARANEAIDSGDYEAAAYHRQQAELESEYAGDESMLVGPNSDQLEWADTYQDQAVDQGAQQSQLAANGDYADAADMSRAAAESHQQADALAGGNDHSGQSLLESDQMDWAAWHQQQADQSLADAVDYAAGGNMDAAESQLNAADSQEQSADWHAELGMHGGDMAIHDPASDFQSNDFDSYSGSGYESTSFDTPTDDFSV